MPSTQLFATGHRNIMNCDIVSAFDKYGIAGLVILALFIMQWIRTKHDAQQHIQWHEDIKANTRAITELNANLGNVCKSKRRDDH